MKGGGCKKCNVGVGGFFGGGVVVKVKV